MVPGLQVTVLLDELSQGDVHMELVWVRVLPTDLQLLDCLTTDLVVLLLKKKKKRQSSETQRVRLWCLLQSAVLVIFLVPLQNTLQNSL